MIEWVKGEAKAEMTLGIHAWVAGWMEISGAHIWREEKRHKKRDFCRQDDQLSFRGLGKTAMAGFETISTCAEKTNKKRNRTTERIRS